MHETNIPTIDVSSVQDATADNLERVYGDYQMRLKYVRDENIRSKVQAVPESKNGRTDNR